MNKRTGVWLDRKKAYIVTLKKDTHHLKIIDSNADFRVREDGEGKIYTRFGNQYGAKEKAKEAKLEKQLKRYYKKIITALSGVDELYVFGPAEAKNELNKMLLEQPNMSIKIEAVKSAGKLTENQIIAAVKKHFDA